ncbi:MAG TPA: nucleotidyltransferase family protein [Rudaea sp.]|uniref:nucleotidyltransferase family protein n=1 Tax=Rudaea sp. TaxID=2136325 RepID=UPI002F9356C5
MDTRAVHGVVLLAAGSSTRLGETKQLLIYRGETLVWRAARAAMATAPGDAVIVLGAQADSIFTQVQDLPLRRVDCADWQAGMGASLRAGIAALSSTCIGALIVLCDQPHLEAAHLESLCAAWRPQPLCAAASLYVGHLGVPALLPRAWFADLQTLEGDRGARDLLAARRDQVIAIANEALALDLDRPGDLALLA